MKLRCLFLTVVCVIGTGQSLGAQALPLKPEAFTAATVQAKSEVLGQIGARRLPLPTDEMIPLVQLGLIDGERDVRISALMAIMSRGSGTRFAGAEPPAIRDAMQRQWLQDRPRLLELRPQVITMAFSDPEPKVRRSAVLAVGNMDFNPRDRELRLTERTIADFSALYVRDADSGVRAEIVKCFALIPNDSPSVRKILVDALSDPSTGVRHYAMAGARRLALPAMLPKVVDGLGDPDSGVRFGAVQALAFYGTSALPHLPTLLQLRETEPDAQVRAEIDRTIAAIRRAEGRR